MPEFPFQGSPYNALALYDSVISSDKKHYGQQNSNQFVLEMLAASISEGHYGKSISTREEAQRVLKETGYHPSMVHATSLKASFANTPLAPKSIDASAQKYPELVLAEVITELSVKEYLTKNNLLIRKPEEIHLQEKKLRIVEDPKETERQKKRMEDIKKIRGKYPHPCSEDIMTDGPMKKEP